MATRHEITSIQFKADAGKANAAIDSIRQKAKEANDQMAQLRQKLEEGKKANLPIEDLKKMEDQLKSTTKEAKQWGDAQRNLMRGVKALDEAIIQFNRGQGSVEKMSAALSKAARNAAQLQQSRMERGSQGWQEMEALITALDKNLVKARQDFDGLVQTIEAGGRVSVSELTSAKQSLKELSDLTAYGSDEWKQYQSQLDAVTKRFDSLSQTEKRLAGEIVTVEDARKRAAAADADEARWREILAERSKQQATADRERAEGALQIAKTNTAWIEQDIAKTKEQLAAQQQLVGSIEALEDAESKAFSKMLAADTALQKQREETNKFSDATWEASKKVGELEAKLKELEAQGGTPKGNATLEQLKKDIAEAELQLTRLKRNLSSNFKQEELADDFAGLTSNQGTVSGKAKLAKTKADAFTSTVDSNRPIMGGIYHDESGYGVASDGKVLLYDKALYDKSKKGKVVATHANKEEKIAVGDEIAGNYPKWRSVSIDRSLPNSGKADLDALSDFLAGVNEREREAWKQAKEAGETKGTLKDWLEGSSVVMKLPDGQYVIMGTATLSKTVAAAKEMGADTMSWGDRDGEPLHFTGERGGAMVMPKSRRDEGTQGWAYDMSGGATSGVSSEGTKAKIAQLEQEIAAKKKLIEVAWQEQQSTQSSVDVDKQKAELQQQLADAQQKLNEAKTAAEGPTKKLQEAEAAYADAQKKEQEATEALAKAKGNMNLGEEEDKLDALERKHDDLTESLQKQNEAQTALAQNVVDTRKKEQEAAIELAQAQNQSEESLNKSVEVLEQQNKTLEAGSAEWQENEQAIGKLNKRIEELKQQSQELRGEVMSLAEAEELADKAMEEQALTTKTGWAAGTEELKRAEQTLADKVAKAKRGTAEEEAAYQKLVRQLQAVRTELGAGSMSGKQMMDVLSNPKNVTSVDTLKAAVSRARQELDALGRRIDQARMDGHTKEAEELAEAYDDIAEGAKNADQRMKELQAQSKGTASAFDKAWSRLKTYVGLYVGAAVAMQKLSQAMGDLLTLSDKMGEVRKTTGFTADEVGRLSNNLAKLDTRTTLTQLMELSSLAGSVGLKTQEQVQGFTEAADQLIVALPELGNESARTIIKIANATGDLEKNGGNVRETLEKVGSTIIALRANSASAAGPITDFVSRVGAVGAQAGISIDQIAALGSTIDALGGRVEMSATALSRMIPAIKNNSFAIANSIGVQEKYLKSLAPMEQMVLIFQKMRDNIQHIDTSTEEGMNAMADNVEAMLGKNATMREVMKDLEQQGARAGIVFGLLSQNVDELQKQLGIASEAYEKNTALANEFNNMNETTAAKWERLKNQVEEFFVGDNAQRNLGWIIDRLRELVDWIAEDGPIVKGLKLIAVYAAAMKMELGASVASAGGAFKNLGIAIGAGINRLGIFTRATASARVEWMKMDAAVKANTWGAVIAALGAILYKFWDMQKAAAEAAAEIGRFNQKVADEKKALDDLFTPLQKANIAQDERSKLISEINSKYSKYLGYMLSETTSAIQLADAHALIAKRIREEAYEKRIMEQEDKVRAKHSDDLNEAYSGITSSIRGNTKGGADVQDVADILKGIVDNRVGGIKYATSNKDNPLRFFSSTPQTSYLLDPTIKQAIDGGIERLIQDGKLSRDNVTQIRHAVYDYTVEAYSQHKEMMTQTSNVRSDLRNVQGSIKGDINANLNDLVKNIKDFGKPQTPAPVATPSPLQKNPVQMWEERMAGIGSLNWQGNTGTQANVQVPLPSDRPQIDRKNIDEVKKYVEYQDQLRGYLQANAGQIDEQTRKTAEMYLESEEEMKKLRALLPKDAGSGSGGNGGGGGANPYGTYNRVTSPYQDWDADALVTRRKEMLERVRALANGADVQAVLSEDAKFISEATRNNIKTTKQAIEWYNTERLKIQDALHEKHLTNTGDWMDPKKGGSKKPKFYESDYALAELDRYYSRRKEALEKAREDENMTEAMFNREVELLEQEHLAKRSKLRETFTSKDKQMIEQFRQWWATLAETGDLAEVPWATVESEWSKATDAQWGANNRKAQEDLTALQGITVKHLNAIAKIIDKERPYDGITANLRDNLLKMDILLADYQKNGPTEDTAALVKAQTERLKFLLGEAEMAYTSTMEDVLRRMGEAGMTAWAEEIRKSPAMQNALMAQLQTAYDEIQNAIKKEATLIKKQTDIWWNDIAQGQTQSRKGGFEKMLTDLGLSEDRVKRANQLIGAGQASERVADKLAIAQMKVRLQMQETYYQRMRQMWADRIASLRAQGKEIDAQHAEMSRNLSLAEEQKKLDEQRVAIANQLEESNNRLYTELKSWADLLTSSLQSVFEASHAGDAEYYNELAKLNLTGKGGPGAGTYIAIDNEGTSDATAHYEYLDEREALERQHEIERENAQAEAWKKVMDDINMKMSETITDQLNAMMQNQALDANTQATIQNTQAMLGLTGVMGGGSGKVLGSGDMGLDENGVPNALKEPESDTPVYKAPWQMTEDDIAQGQENMAAMWQSYTEQGTEAMMQMSENLAEYPGVTPPWQMTEGSMAAGVEGMNAMYQAQKEASDDATSHVMQNQKKMQQGEVSADNRMAASSQSMFAKMIQAANLYGVAYQAMSNDNLDTAQKFEMIALQAVGNAAIAGLTAAISEATAKTAVNQAVTASKDTAEHGSIVGPILTAISTAVLGGLMGLAASKIMKSKSQIAQVTGANNSVASGRLSTGMLTYAEGNVNEFTDPSSLTPGKQYNVDAADGRTYRARYMGRNPKTHLTNGPEFHLSGERGREMIIDAGTTRQITMNEGEIWHAIQTLSGGGRISALRRRGRGVAAFADGNVSEFSDYSEYSESAAAGMSAEQVASLQASIDRQSDLLEDLRINGIKATFDVYGKGGLVDSYDSGKKTLNRYGQRY